MASHGARQQKKLAKQKAKRVEKRVQMARQHSDDPTIRLASAAAWPIVATLVPDNLWSEGLGQLLIARRCPDGRLACGVFLLDVFCLGVKNAYWKVFGVTEYDDLVKKMNRVGRLLRVSAEHFSKLVNCAADYGQALGFAPHADFRHARLLLAGIDPSLCPDDFQFGKDGKPFYVRGPYESIPAARVIAERVQLAGGAYVIPLAPTDRLDGYTAEATDRAQLEHRASEHGEESSEGPALALFQASTMCRR